MREETPMLAARLTHSPLLPTPLVVCLFCLLGLLITGVIMMMIAPWHLTWALSLME
jgi:hypothetical protein